MKKKRYDWSEEEKAAFKVAFTAMKKLMDDMEPIEKMDEEEERPVHYGDDDEERWMSDVLLEIRDSK
jgi:hypothetical protein